MWRRCVRARRAEGELVVHGRAAFGAVGDVGGESFLIGERVRVGLFVDTRVATRIAIELVIRWLVVLRH